MRIFDIIVSAATSVEPVLLLLVVLGVLVALVTGLNLLLAIRWGNLDTVKFVIEMPTAMVGIKPTVSDLHHFYTTTFVGIGIITTIVGWLLTGNPYIGIASLLSTYLVIILLFSLLVMAVLLSNGGDVA